MAETWIDNNDGTMRCTKCGVAAFDPGTAACQCPVGDSVDSTQSARTSLEVATGSPTSGSKRGKAPSAARARRLCAEIAGTLLALGTESHRVVARLRKSKNNKETGRLRSVQAGLLDTAKIFEMARKAASESFQQAVLQEEPEQLARKERLAKQLERLAARAAGGAGKAVVH